jgi:hypothetical protein
MTVQLEIDEVPLEGRKEGFFVAIVKKINDEKISFEMK